MYMEIRIGGGHSDSLAGPQFSSHSIKRLFKLKKQGNTPLP